MDNLAWALGAVVVVSSASLLGALSLTVRATALRRVLHLLVSFAAGAMLGTAFVDLLPHAAERGSRSPFLQALAGFFGFFLLERCIYWYHGVERPEHRQASLRPIILLGDGLHNFLDGLIIGSAFSIGREAGIVTALAVLFHEIPQELGDFGVLLHTGFSPRKALVYNVLTALTAFAGVGLAAVLSSTAEGFTAAMVAVTAGAFLFIGTRLLFDLEHEGRLAGASVELACFAGGILLMGGLSHLLHG